MRSGACIITKDLRVIIGNRDEQHRDLISKNNLTKDEDIIGYYNFYEPFLLVPNTNYYLYDEELCNIAIEKWLDSQS